MSAGHQILHVQGETHDEVLVTEVDQVLRRRPGDDAPDRGEILPADELGHAVPAGAGGDDPGAQQDRKVSQFGRVELDVEVRVHELAEVVGQAAQSLPRLRAARSGQHAVFGHAVERDGHVQQHVVDAVLVDEEAARVQHLDQVGLERGQPF